MNKTVWCGLMLVGLFGIHHLFAQPYTSRLGRFQVNERKGCAPLTVNLIILAGGCNGVQPCNMDFLGNGSQIQNQLSFTYVTPGTYTLKVFSQLNPNQDDIVITVEQNIQPAFELYSCSGRQVQLRVTDTNYDSYLIDFDGNSTVDATIPSGPNQVAGPFTYPGTGAFNVSVRGRDVNSAACNASTQTFNAINVLPAPSITTLTAQDATTLKVDFSSAPNIQFRSEVGTNSATSFQLFQTLYGVSTLNIPNLALDDRFYCVRLNSFDPCANTTALPSNVVCSQNFDLNIQSASNRLAWVTAAAPSPPSNAITGTTIERNGINNYVTLPGSPGQHNDDAPNITCNTDYCYRIINNYAGGVRSISLQKCGRSFTITTPLAIENTSSVVGSAGAQLTWLPIIPAAELETFQIYRAAGTSGFGGISTTTPATFADADYATNANFCYRIDYQDKCGNISAPGLPACPIQLIYSLSPANEVRLNWTAYQGWKNGVTRYTLYKFNQNGGLIQTFPAQTNLDFTDATVDNTNQLVYYQIEAVAVQAGISNSVSNRVEVIKDLQLIRPTAFTPNGDGLNDTFVITGQYINRLSFKVFDRWGGLVFSSDNQEPWDGTRSGKSLPEGAYVWSVNVVDFIGRELKFTGTVALLRK